MYHRSRNLLMSLICLFLLSACGGSSDSSQVKSDALLKGQFIDSPVANLKYRTETQSGVTNDKGEYAYKEGETVTFSIGGIDLPSVKAKATVTPLDLVNTTDTNNLTVVNILRLLQSLDLDGNPDNGIEIGDPAHETAQAMTLSFSSTDFETDVINLIANSGSTTKTLITVETAKAHFQSSLDDIQGGDSNGEDADTANPNCTIGTSILGACKL
jgi:hypothetical protein